MGKAFPVLRFWRWMVVASIVVLFAQFCVAQSTNAVVKRNTYLREGPSGTDKKIILLKAGDELELVEPEPSQDYYHVRTLDGQ